MADSKDGLVSRWSRRKAEAKTPAAREPAPDPAPHAQSGQVEPARETDSGPPAEIDPVELPDPETLDADSDFTVFLKEGVPEAIRRRALRRLWRLNPILANLDGLNDYDDDFTDAATVVAGLKSLYKVGHGFVTEEEEAAEKAAEAGETADAEPNPADPDPAGTGETEPRQETETSEQDSPKESDAGQKLVAKPESERRVPTSATDPAEPPLAVTDGGPHRARAAKPRTARRGALARRWGDRPG